MDGMNRSTGKRLNESAQLLQSIQIILSTPLGSRVMRPDFGSELYNLVDVPLTDINKLRIYKATIEALNKWEKRIKVRKVSATERPEQGEIELNIAATYNENDINFDVALTRLTA